MRKIKLMALLLAALMIVTAFAGCASVKQEDFDAVEDRVSAIEDLLKGQQDIISDLAGKVDANGNQEILDAIDSVKNDLEEKIESVNNRVDEVEKQEPVAGTTVTDATKAKQAEALASIEVQKATFSKNADEYDEATYAAITAALAAAQGEVTSATTEAAVKAAMDKLNATLDTYKTYAMKLYDYYVALLGNVNKDAEALVDEVLDFIDTLEEAYEDAYEDVEDDDDDILFEEFLAEETKYLVSEGTTAAKNVYLNVYDSVVGLCGIFTGADDNYVEYVNAKGKVEDGEFRNLADFEDWAEDIVDDIEAEFGEGVTYEWIVDNKIDDVEDLEEETLWEEYLQYVEAAELIGGEKLVALVTNAKVLTEASDVIANLIDAADAYESLNGKKKDGLYYYNDEDDGLVALVGSTIFLALEDLDEDEDEIYWADEYYSDEIDAALNEWIKEYELSEEDVESIIGEAYEAYLYDRRVVSLIAEAYETFKNDIVPEIKSLNKLSAKSADAVEDFKAVIDALQELYVLQEGDKKAENDLDKLTITLDGEYFVQFVKESGILDITDLKLNAFDGLKAEAIKTISDERMAEFTNLFVVNEDDKDDVTITLEQLTATTLVEVFTFDADKKALERNDGDYLENRKTGDIYDFFKVEYANAENAAEDINEVIKELVKLVENKKVATNKDFVTLLGEYVDAANYDFESADKKLKIEDGVAYVWGEIPAEQEGEEPTEGWVAATGALAGKLYVAVEDVVDYEDLKADFTVKVRGEDVLTIDYFNFKYPVFKDLVDVDDLEAAQEILEKRIVGLFDDIDELETLVEKVGYVRANAYVYEDANKNGKYDADNKAEFDSVVPFDYINDYTVSLSDKAAIDAAVAIYDAWVSNGGNEALEIFDEIVNEDTKKVYGGVYYMKGFEDADGVAKILGTLRELEKQIDNLTKLANKFINGLKVVNSINSYNSISVSASNNKLANDTKVQNLAVTKFVPSTSTSSDVNKAMHGEWSYVYKSTDGYLTTADKTFTTKMSYKNEVEFLKGEPVAVMTKAKVIEFMVDAYQAFYEANLEYTAASDNDYEDGEAVYYVCNDYAAYKAVDDAKASYDKYELIAAQAACLAALGDSASKPADTTFKRQVLNAKTVAELDNVINNYNTVTDKTTTITADDVKDWVIYEFDCLNYDIELQ